MDANDTTTKLAALIGRLRESAKTPAARQRLKGRVIAGAIGVSKETLSRWLQGHVVPGGQNLVALLGYLQRFDKSLTLVDLMGFKEVAQETLPAGAPAAAERN